MRRSNPQKMNLLSFRLVARWWRGKIIKLSPLVLKILFFCVPEHWWKFLSFSSFCLLPGLGLQCTITPGISGTSDRIQSWVSAGQVSTLPIPRKQNKTKIKGKHRRWNHVALLAIFLFKVKFSVLLLLGDIFFCYVAQAGLELINSPVSISRALGFQAWVTMPGNFFLKQC